MAARSKASKTSQPSIEYRWFPLDVAADIGRREDVSTANESHKLTNKQCEPKSPEILSTAQLVSAIGTVWDCANRPLPVFQPRGSVIHGKSIGDKENAVHDDSREERSSNASIANTEYISVGIPQKTSFFRSCNSNVSSSPFWKYPQVGHSSKHIEPWKVNKLVSVGIPNYFEKIYGWLSEKPYVGLQYDVRLSQNKCWKPVETCISENKTSPMNSMITEDTDCGADLSKCIDPPPCNTMKLEENAGESVNSLCLDYFLIPVTNLKAKGTASKTWSSVLCSDYYIDRSDLDTCREFQHISKEYNRLENRVTQPKELFLEDNSKIEEIYSSKRDKQKHSIANKRHAFAGALAGTFVSLCLHPVDTIKTIVQSHGQCQKSIYHVFRSIISERGITGMYRGITSNIACSAPISAIYTFTYESIKGALLPLLPKEYQSIAHCVAGGCSSIATSFIFTPSERIKQQMQVGTHYQNCWTALLGILQKGGLPSLYAGWTAVLCRNIPHSIIKFYTYESLKQLMLSSAESNSPPNTVQTLVCGGLAGSTAALFTTPFDVVKTRLQTQIPGSLSKHGGVLDTLQEIFKHEGLKGLYRGLTPRLIMYVSQGAIFFASYELFKSVLSLDMQQLHPPAAQEKENMEDCSVSSLARPSIPRPA